MKTDREDFEVHGFSPLIGVLASPAVEAASDELAGVPNFADCLAPFARNLPISVKDPSSGQTNTSNVALELRDLRSDGFLLSLTVLPQVLHEVLSSRNSVQSITTSLRAALLRWCEPLDHEALRTFVAVIFAVAAHEEAPLVQLSQLVQAQNAQQHGGPEASNALIPSHCAPPKWFSPTTLKHYVLLQDTRRTDDAMAQEVFTQMCSTYGAESCQLLRVDAQGEGLPDAWREEKVRREVLDRGLDRARRELSAKTGIETSPISVNSVQRPGRASTADREAMGSICALFTAGPLASYVEKTLRNLHEQLAARRGLSKQLTTGMRKWFGTAPAPQPGADKTSVSLSWESPEMQQRRLADLALLFGLSSLAHNNYQSVKKEFAASQATLHHAGALEMASLTAYLSNPLLTAKQFPVRYVTEAVDTYLASTARSTSVLRCALQGVAVLSRYELHREAARELVKLTGLDSDILVGTALSKASEAFGAAGWSRKAAFYRILAGHRLLRADLKSLVLASYLDALPVFCEKGWTFAEDHIAYLLSCESAQKEPLTKKEAELAAECARLLVRPSEFQTDSQQALFYLHYLTTRKAVQPLLGEELRPPVPVVDIQRTKVVRGFFPESTENEISSGDGHHWSDLSRAAWHSIEGASAPWKGGTPLVADEHSHNTKVLETPCDEPFRVLLHVKNPLLVPIRLRNPRLSVTDLKTKEKGETFLPYELPADVTLSPGETRWLELAVVPSAAVVSFRVESLLFSLCPTDADEPSVPVRLVLALKGRRLNKTPAQQKTVVYSTDERLHAAVSRSSWPRVKTRLSKGLPSPYTMFAGQISPLVIEMTNEGHESITGVSLSTDATELVAVAEVGADGRWEPVHSKISAGNADIRVFHPTHSLLDAGKTMRLQFCLRCPEHKTTEFVNGALTSSSELVLFSLSPLKLSIQHTVDALAAKWIGVGVVALRLRNELSSRDAALAKVEILRVRVLSEEPVALTPLRNRTFQLESEQSDTLCVQISPSHENHRDSFWTADEIRDLPVFPHISPRRRGVRRIGVLWKASIVNNDGHVQSLLGETLVLERAEDEVPNEEMEEDENMLHSEDLRKESFLLSFAPLAPITHDFNAKRLCEIPLRLTVVNVDARGRDAKLELRSHPRVVDASQPWQSLPLDARTQLWTFRVLKSCLSLKESRVFILPLRVSRPSVYDDLSLTLRAKFEGEVDWTEIPLPKVPPATVHALPFNPISLN